MLSHPIEDSCKEKGVCFLQILESVEEGDWHKAAEQSTDLLQILDSDECRAECSYHDVCTVRKIVLLIRRLAQKDLENANTI